MVRPPEHCKIVWLRRHEHGPELAEAMSLRIPREADLTQPVGYVRERRDLLAPDARHPSGAQPSPAVDSPSSSDLRRFASPVSAAQTCSDAIASVAVARVLRAGSVE